MTEYWVSKKQYWCKYCSIFIRDDAPSKRQHETGLRHIGNREKYIRDLYKGRNAADKEKAQEAAEIARIEKAAAAAHALDGPSGSSSKPSLLAQLEAAKAKAAVAPSAKKAPPVDKFANYSSAAQLGFDDPGKSQFEINQELKSSIGEAGQWETVELPPAVPTSEDSAEKPVGKRKLGEHDGEDEETDFKFQHRDKRPVRDPYDDDDYDPRAVLGSLKMKVKAEKDVNESVPAPSELAGGSGTLSGTSGTGKLGDQSGRIASSTDHVNRPSASWVKVDVAAELAAMEDAEAETRSGPDENVLEKDVKPDVSAVQTAAEASVKEEFPDDVAPGVNSPAPDGGGGAGGLFKKRRPPPGGGRKR